MTEILLFAFCAFPRIKAPRGLAVSDWLVLSFPNEREMAVSGPSGPPQGSPDPRRSRPHAPTPPSGHPPSSTSTSSASSSGQANIGSLLFCPFCHLNTVVLTLKSVTKVFNLSKLTSPVGGGAELKFYGHCRGFLPKF